MTMKIGAGGARPASISFGLEDGSDAERCGLMPGAGVTLLF